MHYYIGVLAKFAIGFAIVILHMNISGKTQLSQITPIDFIGNFILGGVIGGVIYNDTIPLYQYVFVLLIGIFFISLLNSLSKRLSIFRAMTMGKHIPIIKDGKFIVENIKKNKTRIDIFSLTSQIHAQGIKSLQQIYYAQIEPSGQLTVFCNQQDIPSVLVIANGNIITQNLETIEKTEEWLNIELGKNNIKASDVFVAEFWNGTVSFALKEGGFIKSDETRHSTG